MRWMLADVLAMPINSSLLADLLGGSWGLKSRFYLRGYTHWGIRRIRTPVPSHLSPQAGVGLGRTTRNLALSLYPTP